MRKTAKILLCSGMACALAASGLAAGELRTPSVLAEETHKVAAVYSDMSAVAATSVYVRKSLSVDAADRYMMTAVVKGANRQSTYRFGLSAADNEIGQRLDFVLSTGELASYATLYGTEKRSDLGYRRLITEGISPDEEIEMTVIRDGAWFYFLVNGKLCQIRIFDIADSVPGISASGCTVNASDIRYTADDAEVTSAIEACKVNYKGYGVGNEYANYNGVRIINENSFAFETSAQSKVLEYTRMAFDGTYSGDVEVTFTTSSLAPLPTADTGDGSKWPKLALVLYYDRGYEDMLCLGVGKKQDRVETYIYNEIVQWYNHSDFTGDKSTASVIDRDGDIQFRIVISNNGYSKAFRIYVNGALFALRTSTAYGDIRFGFAGEYVSGTVRDFTVRQL